MAGEVHKHWKQSHWECKWNRTHKVGGENVCPVKTCKKALGLYHNSYRHHVMRHTVKERMEAGLNVYLKLKELSEQEVTAVCKMTLARGYVIPVMF